MKKCKLEENAATSLKAEMIKQSTQKIPYKNKGEIKTLQTKKKKVEKISSKSILQEMKRISSGKGKIIPDTNSHLLKGIEFQKWG